MYEEIDVELMELFGGYNFTKSLQVSSINEGGTIVTGQCKLDVGGPRFSIEAGQKQVPLADTTSTFTLNKVSITNEGRISGELSMKTSDVSRLYVCAEDERQEPGRPIKSFGTIGATYTTPSFSLDTNVDIVNGPTSRCSFLYNYKPWNVKIGTEVQINTHLDDNKAHGAQGGGIELENFNIGAAYQGPSYTISARTSERMSSLSFGYFHQLSKRVAMGTLVNYGLNSNLQSLSMGTSFAIDANNSAKLKINSAADLSGQLKHQLNSWAHLEVHAKLNLHQTGGSNQKIGFGLVFDAESRQ